MSRSGSRAAFRPGAGSRATTGAERSPAAGRRRRAATALVACLGGLAAAAPVGEHEQVRWLGDMRHVALLEPVTATGEAPLLLVLAEPGRAARYALESWRETAERQGLVVAAVSAHTPGAWSLAQDGPGLMRAVVQRIARRRTIDARRVYLFGAGTGGVFALSVAALQPRYFAAVGSFGGGESAPDALIPGEPLARSLPMRIYYSKKAPRHEIEALERTGGDLRRAGADVRVERLGAGPDFRRGGGRVAGAIWAALAEHALGEDPRYQPSRYDR